MGKQSAIEWTDHTHNFWYGCKKVSPGCAHCYAERDMARYGRNFGTVTRAKGFYKPLNWKEPARVFVNSWSDFLIGDADDWREDAFEVIAKTPHLTYQILTKRADRLSQFDWPDNVWLGVSVENQKMADKRIPLLLAANARVRFLSVEPLLEPVELGLMGVVPRTISEQYRPVYSMLHWIIVGGESGPDARPMQPEWARDIRDQCYDVGVPLFFKQWGGNHKVDGTWGGRLLDGREHNAMPELPVRPHQQELF